MRYPEHIESGIERHLLEGDLPAARAAAAGLVEELRSGGRPEPLVLAQLLHECAARVRRAVERVFEPGALLPSRLEVARRLSAAPDADHLLDGFERVVRDVLDAAGEVEHRSASVAERARAFILEHFDDGITTAAVARGVACSEPHLCVEFRRAYGVTVGEYIRRRRIDLAKGLLTGTGLQVKSIAYQVGFRTYRTFLRSFQEEAGRSPTDYRRASRSSGEAAAARDHGPDGELSTPP